MPLRSSLIYLSIHIHLSIYPSINPSKADEFTGDLGRAVPFRSALIYLSIRLSIYLSIFPSKADEFAGDLGRAVPLRSALIKLNNDNLSYPVYDWLYSVREGVENKSTFYRCHFIL